MFNEPQLPVVYIPKSRFTDRTNAALPVLIGALRKGAFMMIEWETLKYAENTPFYVDVVSVICALLIVAVIETKDWLEWKNRRYFWVSLITLLVCWAGITAYAYYPKILGRIGVAGYADQVSPVDPKIAAFEARIAALERDNDFKNTEISNLKRDHGQEASSPPQPSLPATIAPDDIEARIDVWKSIDGQMSDLDQLLIEGDRIVSDWKGGRAKLQPMVADFRQGLAVLRNRLSQLIGSNPEFSDLKVIDQSASTKLASAIENLIETLSQVPEGGDQSKFESTIGPYIGPVKRELGPVKQWVASIKKLAASSIADLSARQVSK